MRIRNGVVFLAIAVLVMGVFVMPGMADEAFHVNSRHEGISTDGIIVTGLLLLNVLNTSGEDVRDLEAWIEGPNRVTFDNHRIFLGDIADGQQLEIVDMLNVPKEIFNAPPVEDSLIWTLEYTKSSGERVTTTVAGQMVQ